MDEVLPVSGRKNGAMITTTLWNFINRQASSFRFVLTRIGAFNFVVKHTGFKFVNTQQGKFTFKIGVESGPWILQTGFWNDSGIWVDAQLWKDN